MIKASALVVGGAGSLGRAVVTALRKAGAKTLSLDYMENKEADCSLLMNKTATWKENLQSARHQLQGQMAAEAGGQQMPLRLVYSAAGGFAMGAIGDTSMPESVDSMLNMNLKGAVMAAALAFSPATSLTGNGLLILTGAQAALGPTPAFIGYGMSKAATHHLIASLAADGTITGEGKPRVVAILPQTIDTPANRQAMGEDSLSNWTPTDQIAAKVVEWCNVVDGGVDRRPPNGALVKVSTLQRETLWELVR